MRTLKFLLAAAVAVTASPSMARKRGPNHSHGRGPLKNVSMVEARARAVVHRSSDIGKLPVSWKKIQAAVSTEKVELANKKWEWLSVFENPEEKENPTVYVYLTPAGDYSSWGFSKKQGDTQKIGSPINSMEKQ